MKVAPLSWRCDFDDVHRALSGSWMTGKARDSHVNRDRAMSQRPVSWYSPELDRDMPVALADRNILITGASGGIGAALARAYAAAGSHLVLWGRNRQRLAETERQCLDRGATVEIEDFDIVDNDRLISSLEALDARTPLDVAIFNAGVGGTVPQNQIAQTPRSTRKMGLVNFISPLVGANLLAERMAMRGRGHIVFMGSIAESFPLPTAPTYSATKAGLALFSEALRLRLRPSGVAVSLVSP